jgi:uncharacterized coiled-coil protein SlyX
MSDEHAQHIERLTSRLVDLEIRFTHLERTLGELDEVALSHGKQLEAIERRLAALGSELRTVSASIVEERKPEDEKPPHY